MTEAAPGPLTDQQRHILDWIGTYTLRHDRPPSYREAAAALGMKCHSTAQHHMGSLRRLGYIRWEKGRSQTLQFFHPDGTWRPTPPPKIL